MAAAKYTFNRRCGAFTASGKGLVYVPDQVIEDQSGFFGMSFTVMRRDGSKTRGTLKPYSVEELTLGTDSKGKTLAQLAPVVTLH